MFGRCLRLLPECVKHQNSVRILGEVKELVDAPSPSGDFLTHTPINLVGQNQLVRSAAAPGRAFSHDAKRDELIKIARSGVLRAFC